MITGIILASGFSRRMKKDKLLLEIGGEKVIERVIKACVESTLDNIILVYRKEEVKEIGEKYSVKTIYNENAHLGQSESLKLGTKEAGDTEAYMFLVGDQPFLTKELINKLIKEYQTTKSSIIVPYFNGNRGMPMIMSSKFREDLLEVQGDKGGRDIVNANYQEVRKVHLEEFMEGKDIDTPEDLKSL